MHTRDERFFGMGPGDGTNQVDPGDLHSLGDRTKGKKSSDRTKIFQKIKRGNMCFFFQRLLTDTKSCDKVEASEERGYKR